MERLNRTNAPAAKTYTEKIIQFGEGNFLRAFVDWIVWKTNQKTDFNASVVVVQPIDRGMVDAQAEMLLGSQIYFDIVSVGATIRRV